MISISVMAAKTLIFLIMLLTSIKALPQTQRFKHITSDNGISQSEIYVFLEDSKGFMWFGTVDGLNKYDGYNIEIFNTERNNPNSLSHNTIRSLAEDHLGHIWIGTDNGLNVYNPKTERIHQIENKEVGNSLLKINALYCGDSKILAGTSMGLMKIDIESNSIEKMANSFSLVNTKSNRTITNVLSIISSKEGGVWVMNPNSIVKVVIQPNNDAFIIEEPKITPNAGYKAIVEDSNGNLWVANQKLGLLRYNVKTGETNHISKSGNRHGLSSDKCSSLTFDKDGNLWIGTTDKGLNFIKKEDLNKREIHFEHIQNDPLNQNSLNSNLIYSIYSSKDNLLWVGTIGSGVNIFDPQQKKFVHYRLHQSTNTSAQSSFIRSLYADINNNIWAGTHNNGLFLVNRENMTFRKLGFGTESVFSISQYQKDKVFICSSNGVSLVQYTGNKLKLLSTFRTSATFDIVQSDETVYWLASINGLSRLTVINDQIVHDKTYSTRTKPDISFNNCRVLLYNKIDNELLVGTEGGGLNIVHLNDAHHPKMISVYKKSNDTRSISNNYIRSIIKDSKGNIWIGTYEGINKIIRNKSTGTIDFQSYSRLDGLPNNMIESMVEDKQGYLWVGTNGGLCKFDTESNHFTLFSTSDGIQSNEFSENVVFKKPDGEIIMGGINGINSFYPQEIVNSTLVPKTTITGFYLFNQKIKARQKVGKHVPLKQSIAYTDTIKLLPKQNNIGFDFSAMLPSNPEKIKYAYKLEGFETDWNTTTARNRNANYTNLKHGKYVFKIKSTNEDGIWEDKPKEIFIHIKTPFVYSWLAYLLYLLAAVLIFLFFSYYSIIRYATKNQIILQNEHNQKLHELDLLRTKFFINISHDLRTPLSLISGPLESVIKSPSLSTEIKEKLSLIKRNVKRLNNLIEQLLDVNKAENGKLIPKLVLKDMVNYTKAEVSHFTYAASKKGLSLNVSSNPKEIKANFDPVMLSKVYFNLMSNALKYTDQGRISVHIERTDNTPKGIPHDAEHHSFIKVEVKDTGKGISKEDLERIFDRFYQDKKNLGDGYGIGLSHCMDLIRAHEGYMEAISTIGEGTTVRFFIPDHADDITREFSTEDLYIDSGIKDSVSPAQTEERRVETILIIEDNVDMRTFIKKELESDYKIVESYDGIDGLKKANLNLPDLIISDVMMPHMDGITFCRQIKSNVNTSHIPIILLTAKAETKTKYEGIETGADDYILKPFEMDYLIIKIKNLLQNRERLRKQFQNNLAFEPSAITVNSVDEKFLSSLFAALEKNIPDSEFTISSLEAEMGMSHANFYRKIKSLTGQSGKELIQEMRLKRAHQILKDNKDIRIAEVAYLVGFTNPKYFSQCFKKRFGDLPSNINQG